MTAASQPRGYEPRRREVHAVRRLYRGQTQFDFINRWKIWFAASGFVILVGLVALAVGGLNFSIDFRGGTVWEVPTTASVATVRADISKISAAIGQGTIVRLTNHETGKENIELEAAANITSNATIVQKVTKELATIGHVNTDAVNLQAVGPSWGSAISEKAIEAVIVFLVLIAVCITVYFEAKMAVGALVALLHDMLVTIGIYALSGFQVSPDTVIAFLTVLGYSIYDTIVVFDKVKENTRGLASTNRATYTDVVNLSMNQVLARSINTSFVAVMPVFCILVIGAWIMGASALNDFGLALFIGLMSGAYSSIFIASPILALLKEREPRYVEIRKRLKAYPQSRQILTAATVADGMLMASRANVLQSGTGAGKPGERAALGAGRPVLSATPVGAGTGAGDSEFEGYSGAMRPRSPAGDVTSQGGVGPSQSGSAVGGNGFPPGASAGAGASEGGSAGAGTGKSPVPRRPGPPRPRRKVPRHR
jgi:preprotein translocase subunit SecF